MDAYWQVDRQASRYKLPRNIAGESKETLRVYGNLGDLAEGNGARSVYMYEWLIGESGNG